MSIDPWLLKERQGLDLELKERLTAQRIEEWYKHFNGNVYVSFSGGKDSTVLLHQVRRLYPGVPAVFCDTGLEYPEIRSFVRSIENVIWLKPKLAFHKVIQKYGYPVVSKETSQKIREIRTTKSDKLRNKRLHGDGKGNGKLSEKWKFLVDAPFEISDRCCYIMKKYPIKHYEKCGKKPFVGTMASDSSIRKSSYLRTGCNSFEGRCISRPLSFWLEVDIWSYIRKYNVSYSLIYNKGVDRTGCMFCMFGVHLEKGENRFQRMKKTHPKQYDYCINRLGCGKVLDYIGVKY